jgi:hypothetical protein
MYRLLTYFFKHARCQLQQAHFREQWRGLTTKQLTGSANFDTDVERRSVSREARLH